MNYFNQSTNNFEIGDSTIWQWQPAYQPIPQFFTNNTMNYFETLKAMLDSVGCKYEIEDENLQGKCLNLSFKVICVNDTRFVFNESGVLITVV